MIVIFKVEPLRPPRHVVRTIAQPLEYLGGFFIDRRYEALSRLLNVITWKLKFAVANSPRRCLAFRHAALLMSSPECDWRQALRKAPFGDQPSRRGALYV